MLAAITPAFDERGSPPHAATSVAFEQVEWTRAESETWRVGRGSGALEPSVLDVDKAGAAPAATIR
jgi:hypothetical protein